MNTSGKQICICKSHNIKQLWNTKTSHYHITATPHYYRKTFCSYSYILVVHFTASAIWGLQKLGSVGMVSYHYMFLIKKCFWLHPNLNEVVLVGPILILAVVIFSNIYNISNLNDTLQIWPDVSNCNCTQAEWSSFNYPNMIKAVGICPNVSKCVQIYLKWLYIIQIGMKLLQVP